MQERKQRLTKRTCGKIKFSVIDVYITDETDSEIFVVRFLFFKWQMKQPLMNRCKMQLQCYLHHSYNIDFICRSFMHHGHYYCLLFIDQRSTASHKSIRLDFIWEELSPICSLNWFGRMHANPFTWKLKTIKKAILLVKIRDACSIIIIIVEVNYNWIRLKCVLIGFFWHPFTGRLCSHVSSFNKIFHSLIWCGNTR